MSVEGDYLFAPAELWDHVAEQIDVVLGALKIGMGFHEGVGSSLYSWVHVCPLELAVVLRLGDGVEVIEIPDIADIVVEPDGGMEGHLIVLYKEGHTMRSRSLDSLEKI